MANQEACNYNHIPIQYLSCVGDMTTCFWTCSQSKVRHLLGQDQCTRT